MAHTLPGILCGLSLTIPFLDNVVSEQYSNNRRPAKTSFLPSSQNGGSWWDTCDSCWVFAYMDIESKYGKELVRWPWRPRQAFLSDLFCVCGRILFVRKFPDIFRVVVVIPLSSLCIVFSFLPSLCNFHFFPSISFSFVGSLITFSCTVACIFCFTGCHAAGVSEEKETCENSESFRTYVLLCLSRSSKTYQSFWRKLREGEGEGEGGRGRGGGGGRERGGGERESERARVSACVCACVRVYC